MANGEAGKTPPVGTSVPPFGRASSGCLPWGLCRTGASDAAARVHGPHPEAQATPLALCPHFCGIAARLRGRRARLARDPLCHGFSGSTPRPVQRRPPSHDWFRPQEAELCRGCPDERRQGVGAGGQWGRRLDHSEPSRWPLRPLQVVHVEAVGRSACTTLSCAHGESCQRSPRRIPALDRLDLGSGGAEALFIACPMVEGFPHADRSTHDNPVPRGVGLRGARRGGFDA
jgi:hypothetical protein